MNNLRISRDRYLDRLVEFKDKHVIKIITGIRHCGKSTLLEMYSYHLISSGIDENNVMLLNFSESSFSDISLENIVDGLKKRNGRTYVLLDEVQMQDSWDEMIIDVFKNLNCDICIAGSISTISSSKLSMLPPESMMSMELSPFSYEEFLRYTEEEDSNDLMMDYMTYGGFPLALMVRISENAKIAAIEGIYNTIILKDIVFTKNIRNPQMLENVSEFLMTNIGNLLSVKSIRDHMTDNGSKVNFETIDGYLGYLEEALIFHRVKRYNIKTKEEFVVNDKFYLTDPGIGTAVLGRRMNTGRIMENLVYLELRRRGFTVFVGKLDDEEIDFVIVNDSCKMYIQVCYSLEDPSVLDRKVHALKSVNDDHRKIIIVMDRSEKNHDGIIEITLRELLTGAPI